jgi:predicted transcriptional regulator
MTTSRTLLLSLRPRFAAAILDGTKRVELRRIRPRAKPGTPVLIYASTPTKALVGGCWVSGLVVAEPDEVWELHGHLTSVDRAEFDDYFAGAGHAVAIQVANPWTLDEALGLQVLRERWPGFHPPQSFRYLDRAEARSAVNIPPRLHASA